MWLEVAGYKLGIPYKEFASMPIGELTDLYNVYLASEGVVEIKKTITGKYIPENVR